MENTANQPIELVQQHTRQARTFLRLVRHRQFLPIHHRIFTLQSFSYTKNYKAINHIIMHCRKSLLFDKETTWTKKNHSNMFDVTMGTFNGAEVCEFLGLFLLDNLNDKNNVRLYRDDGLVLLRNASGPQSERTRKDNTREFKKQALSRCHPKPNRSRKTRQRNIIWLNPP